LRAPSPAGCRARRSPGLRPRPRELLLRRVPGETLDRGKLRARVDAGIELEQRGAELEREDRLAVEPGRAHRDRASLVSTSLPFASARVSRKSQSQQRYCTCCAWRTAVASTSASISAASSSEPMMSPSVWSKKQALRSPPSAWRQCAALDHQLRRGAVAHLEALAHHYAAEDRRGVGFRAGDDLDRAPGTKCSVLLNGKSLSPPGRRGRPGAPRRCGSPPS
jgi:hypothetical protein